MTTNPCTSAAEVAKLLDSDLIMASQIKQYLSIERLCAILEIEPNHTDQALIDLVVKRKLVDACLKHAENSDLLEEISNRL